MRGALLAGMLLPGIASADCLSGTYPADGLRTVASLAVWSNDEGDQLTWLRVRFHGDAAVWETEATCVSPEAVGGTAPPIRFCHARCGGAFLVQPTDAWGMILKVRGGVRLGMDCAGGAALPMLEDPGEAETIYLLAEAPETECRP